MTEAHVRQLLTTAVLTAFALGRADGQGAETTPVSDLAERAADVIMHAVADLVQEALEVGFDGRAELAT